MKCDIFYNCFCIATWDKYDGFVYPDPGLFGMFSYGIQKEDRKYFVKEFFPKWSGFHVTAHDCDLPPVTAVKQLDNLVESISRVWTKRISGTPICNKIPPSDLKLSEVSIFLLHHNVEKVCAHKHSVI